MENTKNDKKCNIILTTKGGMEFGVSCACTQDDLHAAANHWKTVLNTKYGGTGWEITGYRMASEDEIKEFLPFPEDLEDPKNWSTK